MASINSSNNAMDVLKTVKIPLDIQHSLSFGPADNERCKVRQCLADTLNYMPCSGLGQSKLVTHFTNGAFGTQPPQSQLQLFSDVNGRSSSTVAIRREMRGITNSVDDNIKRAPGQSEVSTEITIRLLGYCDFTVSFLTRNMGTTGRAEASYFCKRRIQQRKANKFIHETFMNLTCLWRAHQSSDNRNDGSSNSALRRRLSASMMPIREKLWSDRPANVKSDSHEMLLASSSPTPRGHVAVGLVQVKFPARPRDQG